uniref:Ras-related protein Rab-32 n=1 Tax=Cacopsylla melanoneura TaxID=428564 RepID=A0A8D8UX49_9HEMI
MDHKKTSSSTQSSVSTPAKSQSVSPDEESVSIPVKKYSTLPGTSSLAVISNEKTNLRFGSVFSLSSLSDHSDKTPRKYSVSSQSPQSEKAPRRKLSLGEKIVKKLSLSVDRINEKSVDPLPLSRVVTPETPEPSSDTPSVKKSKFKLFKKLSFSKKPKKETLSEDTMDGKNGKGKKKGGKNKWKKVNPGEDLEKQGLGAGPDSAAQSSAAFLNAEREVKEKQEEKGSNDSNTLPAVPPPDTNLLATPAQSQDWDSTTDNDDYDTPMGTSPVSSQVMNPESVDTISDEQDLEITLKQTPTPVVTPTGDNTPTNLKKKIVNIAPSSEQAAVTPSDLKKEILSITPSSEQADKTPSDLKKEILSITTPVVTEAGRNKKQSNSEYSHKEHKAAAVAGNGNGASVSSAVTNGSSPYTKMPQPADKREFLYKILVIGELGAGKTSIIKRYVHQFFSPHYRATIGVDFALKVIPWDPETIIRLQLWDIAGQERFGNMTRVYYKEAVGAFIVFDVTRAATFDAVLKWKQDLDAKVTLPDGNPIPCVLLANKCDQPKEGIANNPNKIDEFIKENHFSGWFETSAKDNINIDDAAKMLVHKILENDKVQSNGNSLPTNEPMFSLSKDQNTKNGKNCAC